MATEPIEDYYDGDMGRPYGPDIVGAVYMDMLSGRSNKWNYAAQYFTPYSVALMMARMVNHDRGAAEAEFKRQVLEAVKCDPILEAMTIAAGLFGMAGDAAEGEEAFDARGQSLAWWAEHAWPLIKPKLQPITICEPAVGSGIMLLAAASCYPLWLSQIGFVQYFGQDIDELCVDMCRLNLKLYGITPMRITRATVDALEEWLPKVNSKLAERYTEVLTAEASGDTSARGALVEEINAQRVEQISLFGDITPGVIKSNRKKQRGKTSSGGKDAPDLLLFADSKNESQES
jgi:hypothetical protein